jgi:hypothetical protein
MAFHLTLDDSIMSINHVQEAKNKYIEQPHKLRHLETLLLINSFLSSDKACLGVSANKLHDCLVHCGVDCALTVEIVINALTFSNKAEDFFQKSQIQWCDIFYPSGAVHYNKTIALPNEQQFKNNIGQGNIISINP